MCRLITVLLLLLSVVANANQLPNNTSDRFPLVKQYKEGPDGIPTHISGLLSLDQATPGSEVAASITFFENNKDIFSMTDPANELAVKQVDVDQYGNTHIRFRQFHRGIPVYAREMLAHFDSKRHRTTVNGAYLPQTEINTTPSITALQASAFAVLELAGHFGSGQATDPELTIFPWEDQNLLVWRLHINSDLPPAQWEYFVDAQSGEVLYRIDRMQYSTATGTGIGVMGGPRTHIDLDYTGSFYQMADYTRQAANDPHGHGGQLPPGAGIRTYDASGGSLPGSLVQDADTVFDDPAQAAAVDGQVYTSLMYDWMLRELGRNSYDDNGASMTISVDWSAGYNNANWNGTQVAIWMWGGSTRSLAGCPDVVSHEWAHAITSYTGGMIYEKEYGALNESFSDMVGAAFEFEYDSLDSPDWYMGENGQVNGNGFRSLSNPHEMGDPDYYGPEDEFWVDVTNCTPSGGNDNCGVHTNSGVGNKWFYLLSDGGSHHGINVEGIGVENAIVVAYTANAYYWYPTVDYANAALGTLAAADILDTTFYWSIQVANAWNAVGVSTQNPELFFTVDTSIGWVPFTVEFQGNSILSVDEWFWDFGDGDSAFIQNPGHEYRDAGLYGIGLAVNSSSGQRNLFRQAAIIALADSLICDNHVVLPGETVEVPIYARNTVPMSSFILPVEFDGNYTLIYDSFSTAGCRTEYFDQAQLINIIPSSKRLTIGMQIGVTQEELPPGTGDILKLYFTVDAGAPLGQITYIDMSGYNDFQPGFFGVIAEYEPLIGVGRVSDGACCVGLRGDVNGDGGVLPDVSDLTYLVDYLFGGGEAPDCEDEADINGSGTVDVADLTYMVDYLFGGGPMPAFCS